MEPLSSSSSYTQFNKLLNFGIPGWNQDLESKEVVDTFSSQYALDHYGWDAERHDWCRSVFQLQGRQNTWMIFWNTYNAIWTNVPWIYPVNKTSYYCGVKVWMRRQLWSPRKWLSHWITLWLQLKKSAKVTHISYMFHKRCKRMGN